MQFRTEAGALTLLAIIFAHLIAFSSVVECRKKSSTFLGLPDDNIQLDRNWNKETLRRLVRSPQVPDTDADSDEESDEKPKAKDNETEINKKAKPGELYLPENYNKLEIPKSTFAGIEIEVEAPVSMHINIRSIAEINEADEQIVFEMDVIVEWLDAALTSIALSKWGNDDEEDDASITQKVLDPSFLKRIWKPDIFIEDLVSVTQPDFMGKPARLKFSPAGIITYSTRVKVKMECDLDFTYYPADTQKCNVIFRSYSHNSTALELKWRPPVGVYLLYPDDDNFDIAVDSLRRFRLIVHEDQDLRMNETFDCLEFTIKARRKLSYHLVQTYIPSMLYIAITWLCFMVPKKMIEARMAIAMTTLLTLTAMFSSVRESTPVVSYTKAIDLWCIGCVMFVFAVLLEFSLLLWTESQKNEEEEAQKEKTKDEKEDMELENLQDPNDSRKGDREYSIKQSPTIGQRLRTSVLQTSSVAINFIETYSFILVLLIFITFNLLYWTWLLVNSGYYDWNVNVTHNAVGQLKSERELKDLILFSDD